MAFSLLAWQEKMRGGGASSLSPSELRISRGREPGLGEDEPITEQGRVAACWCVAHGGKGVHYPSEVHKGMGVGGYLLLSGVWKHRGH